MAGEPTRWSRIEPRSRDRSLAPGLEARVHDPLWLLGRQWQFGELQADGDLGSAIAATVTARVAPLTRLRRGAGAPEAYDVRAAPLEALVEAEDVRAAPTARMRVRAGQHFERLLAARGVGRYAADYRGRYALDTAIDTDGASRRFLALVAGRAIDGARLYRDLAAALRRTPPALPAEPAIDPADAEAVRAAARAWLAWADALLLAPAGGPAAWVSERLEHAFAVTAADGTALVADEYADGRLEWHAFAAPDPPAAGGVATQTDPLTVVPAAVTYPGMPASRLWEFEDARVDFGAIDADPEDLGRMLLTEFALVYGGDWLLVPLEAPVGALVEIVRLEVRDTFGQTVAVEPTARPREWGMFGISGAGVPLLLAPAIAASLHGPAVEEVALLRDEAANLAWAVERTVEGEHGRPVDRAQVAYERGPAQPPPPAAADVLAYRLRTDPPEHWLPLAPRRAEPLDPSMTFRLGAIAGAAAHGRLLAGEDVVIREEEIPREGALVTRAYQLARWIDGTTFLWLGRRKATGRGEGSSGLRFDVLERSPASRTP